MAFFRNFLVSILFAAYVFGSPAYGQVKITGTNGSQLTASALSQFNNPWAIAFLSTDLLLVSTKPGILWLVKSNGEKQKVDGIPEVAHAGQGGLGDVVPHPQYVNNNWIYLSYIEEDKANGTKGAVVVKGTLDLDGTPTLRNLTRVWTQIPKMQSEGHYSHRLAF